MEDAGGGQVNGGAKQKATRARWALPGGSPEKDGAGRSSLNWLNVSQFRDERTRRARRV